MATKKPRKVRVALVDAHPVVRSGLEVSLARHPGLTVVSTGSDVEEAFRDAKASPPDVVIIDAGSPASAARQIRRRFPHAKVIVFASADSEEQVREAARGGVQGYLWKSAPVEDVVRAVETVHGGGVYFGARASPALVFSRKRGARKVESFTGLTRRERQVVKLVAEGHTSRDIARLLRVSIRTVESHREHISRKLGIHTVAGLTRFAIANGIVEPD